MSYRQDLIELATQAMENSYSPYSNFKVGAALICKNTNRTFTGSNVENASYSLTNCAERTAFFKAVSEGIRDFRAIAIVGGKDGIVTDYCMPCGACRQVMAEFCDADFEIITTNGTDIKVRRLSDLLPEVFEI